MTTHAGQLGYEVLDKTTGAHIGWLAPYGVTDSGVAIVSGDEPVFGGDINSCARPITFGLSVDPDTVMSPFDLVRVYQPDGYVMGTWIYEDAARDTGKSESWKVTLMPLGEELQSVDFVGNYSAVPTPAPMLGTAKWSVPVLAAIAGTRHLTPQTVTDDGVAYALQFAAPNARARDTLTKATELGGLSWWWYCDSVGRVDLRNTPRQQVTIVRNTQIIYEQPVKSMQPIYNVLPLTGGAPPDAFGFPLTLTTTRTQASGPYGTTAIGRKVSTAWSDLSVMDLATLNKLGDSILARAQVRGFTTIIRCSDIASRVDPGDQVRIQEPDGSFGPWLWVTSTREEGSTGVFVITAATEMGTYHSNPGAALTQSYQAGGQTVLGIPNTPGGSGGGGGTGTGQIPFVHLPTATESGSGAGTVLTQDFICDSGIGLLFRATAQVDHTGAAGSYDLAILGGGGFVTTQCHVTRAVDANGQTTVILETDTPLTDGTYRLALTVSVSGAWSAVTDVQLDVFG